MNHECRKYPKTAIKRPIYRLQSVWFPHCFIFLGFSTHYHLQPIILRIFTYCPINNKIFYKIYLDRNTLKYLPTKNVLIILIFSIKWEKFKEQFSTEIITPVVCLPLLFLIYSLTIKYNLLKTMFIIKVPNKTRDTRSVIHFTTLYNAF